MVSEEVSIVEIELLRKVVNTMLDWSGVSDNTPDDFEIMSDPPGLVSVTLGDLRDASLLLNKLWNVAAVAKNGKVTVE